MDIHFLERMKAFLDDHNFALYTEHLSFCSDARHHYDLYPIPFTQEAVHHVAGWMRLAQDILERPIALENASYYVKLPLAEMDELAFINAVPKRTELMSRVIIEQLLAQAETANIHTLDLTGGAPEMHPDFRYLVRTARNQGIKVIDRCNLTIPEAPGYEDLAVFLAAQQVQITASLPCYLEENVENLMCLNTLSIDW